MQAKARHVTQPDYAHQITANCLLGRTRTLSRVLTSLYDEELRPHGVQGSQLASLAIIAAHGPMRRTEVGRWLHLDSSTLTRNLRVMQVQGWIEETADEEDGRGRPVQATAAGRALLDQVGPAWQAAQRRAARLIGPEAKATLLALFDALQETG